jgi:large subunit ribosomal protein L23
MGLLNRKKTEIKKADEAAIEPVVSSDKKSEVGVKSSRIILRPLVTEKAAVAQSLNKYAFIVKRDATKPEIKRAIKEIYGILPVAVNVVHVDGKIRNAGKHRGRRQDYKKALVTLPEGKSIAIHEGV